MFYDRKIKYFDYIEHGQRLRNGGFVKLEVRDDVCNVSIQIAGLHAATNNTYQIYILSGDRREVLCEIQLAQGKGSKALCLQRDNLCAGISYSQMEAIQIPISQTRELRCRVAEKVREQVLRESPKEAEQQVVLQAEPEVAEEVMQEAEKAVEKESAKEVANEAVKEIEKEAVKAATVETNCEKPEQKDAEIARKVPLMEDKWKQLSVIYPHITPFHDEREYLSIGPGDFVIMPHKYYKLVNNSFLLHGFYNYKHLILARVENRGEMRYYIGVPGNYYEREKQVALMFGFESFECREEPAGSGDFGYYMIRVEI